MLLSTSDVCSKLKLYRTVIRPVVTYASETWVLKEAIIQKLLVFERKILRRIFGPTKENRIWRVKTNEELDKLIKHKNIINYIKAQRLSWFGHIQRMPDTRTVKKIEGIVMRYVDRLLASSIPIGIVMRYG